MYSPVIKSLNNVPKTAYFENQPPTKIFEYFLSGLPVIATTTKATRSFFSNDTGVLIEDNPRSFADGIVKILEQKESWDSKKIRELNYKYHWSEICKDYLHYIKSEVL